MLSLSGVIRLRVRAATLASRSDRWRSSTTTTRKCGASAGTSPELCSALRVTTAACACGRVGEYGTRRSTVESRNVGVLFAANYLENWKSIAVLKGDSSQAAETTLHGHNSVTADSPLTTHIASRYKLAPVGSKAEVPWH